MFIDLKPFRHKNFRKLFLGQLISSFGTQMTAVVIPFQVFMITQSTLYTGLVSGLEFILLFIASLLGGVVADRFDKRSILIFTEIGLSLAPVGLALNALLSPTPLLPIFILAAITSFLSGLHRPALEALTPRLVPEEDINKVSALAPTRQILTGILSPVIGGFAMISIGPFYTYLFDAASFLISLFFLIGITKQTLTAPTTRASILAEIKEGYNYIKSRKEILGSYLSDFFVMVFCNPFALYPALASAFGKTEWVGMLYAAPALGALLMTSTSRWTLSQTRYGVFIITTGALWACSLTLVGLAPTFALVLIGVFLAGFFDMISGVFRLSLWNETIPDSIRGRMAGFEMISYMSGPLLGNALLGFVADRIGVQNALLYGSLLSLTILALYNLSSSSLWKYKKVVS